MPPLCHRGRSRLHFTVEGSEEGAVAGMVCTGCEEKIQGSTQNKVGWDCPFKFFLTEIPQSCEVGLVCDLCITDEWSGKSIGFGNWRLPGGLWQII